MQRRETTGDKSELPPFPQLSSPHSENQDIRRIISEIDFYQKRSQPNLELKRRIEEHLTDLENKTTEKKTKEMIQQAHSVFNKGGKEDMIAAINILGSID